MLTGDSFFHLSALGERLPGMNLCGAGRVVCLIDPVGDVYACPFAVHPTFRAGNLRDHEGLAQIWAESTTFQQLRASAGTRTSGSCQAFDVCRGGCMLPSSSPADAWTIPTPNVLGHSVEPSLKPSSLSVLVYSAAIGGPPRRRRLGASPQALRHRPTGCGIRGMTDPSAWRLGDATTSSVEPAALVLIPLGSTEQHDPHPPAQRRPAHCAPGRPRNRYKPQRRPGGSGSRPQWTSALAANIKPSPAPCRSVGRHCRRC